jgi:hypothetical protein
MWLSRRDLGKLGAWMSPRFTREDNHACQHAVAYAECRGSQVGDRAIGNHNPWQTGTVAVFGKPAGRARAEFASCGARSQVGFELTPGKEEE